jgi:hypothetical protein
MLIEMTLEGLLWKAKGILVILSVPTGRHCPLHTFWLNRWTPLSITQPLQLGS